MFRNKKKLPSKVKYQSSHFKTKLDRARTYQRHPGGWSKVVRSVRAWRWSVRVWIGVVGAVCILSALLYLSLYPNWFFVREVRITGVRTALAEELRGQVDRYLAQRKYLVPQKNLLFLSSRDLESYLIAVNPGVWQVQEVRKQWPHTLVLHVAPRDPLFVVTTQEGVWLVSNDGLAMPTVTQPATALPVSAVGLKKPELGRHYFTGNLLATLVAVKKDFAGIVGLPQPVQVVLRPVIIDLHALGESTLGTPATASASVSVGMQEVRDNNSADLMPDEIEVLIPAGERTAAFSVYLQVAERFDEVFRQLQVLVSKQSPERLHQLAYIDMRFAGKAFICLQNTPCAKPRTGNVPQIQEGAATVPSQ